MIRYIYTDDGEITASTVGCGCCSSDLHDKSEIMEELKKNVRVLKDSADTFGISLDELIKQLL